MSGWSPMLDMLIIALVISSVGFGWVVRADKADRDVQKAYDRGYADAVRQHGR